MVLADARRDPAGFLGWLPKPGDRGHGRAAAWCGWAAWAVAGAHPLHHQGAPRLPPLGPLPVAPSAAWSAFTVLPSLAHLLWSRLDSPLSWSGRVSAPGDGCRPVHPTAGLRWEGRQCSAWEGLRRAVPCTEASEMDSVGPPPPGQPCWRCPMQGAVLPPQQ